MSTKPIRVIQTSPSECKVDQPVVVVSRGAQPGAPDRLQFINLTKDDIEVFIPARVFSAASIALPPIAPQGHDYTGNVWNEADIEARPYTVYCKATNTNAIGNSDPQVVVEP